MLLVPGALGLLHLEPPTPVVMALLA